MDPVDVLIATLKAIVAIGLLFVVPGLTLGPILVPGASSPLARAGRAIGVSIVVTAFGATILARLGLLRPTILYALLLSLTLLPLHSRLPSRPRRPTGRMFRWWIGALAAALLLVGVVLGPSRLASGGSLVPPGPTAWSEVSSAMAAARTGAFPAEWRAWGETQAVRLDGGPATGHVAAAFMLLPGDPPVDPLVQLETYRLALLASAVLLGILLFRRWASSWLAVLGMVLLFRALRIDDLVSGFNPAGWAFVVALFGAWLADRAFVERAIGGRGLRLGLMAVAAGASVLATSGIVFLVLAAAVAGLAIARSVVRPGGGPVEAGGLGYRHGRSVGLRAPIAAAAWPLGIGAAIVGGALVAGLLADVVLDGRSRALDAIAAGSRGAGAAVELPADEVPPGWRPSGDAGWDFHAAADDGRALGEAAPSRFLDGRFMPDAVLHVWPWVDGRQVVPLLVLAGLLAIPVAGWPFSDARRQRATLAWLAFAALVLAGSFAIFSAVSDYVPRRAGPEGLLPFVAIVPVVAAVLGLWWLDRLLRSRLATDDGRPRRALASAILTLVAMALVLPVRPTPQSVAERPPVLSPLGYETYRWVANRLPTGVRVLGNGWTDGAFAAIAERAGIVDGPAPYLEAPEELAAATGRLLAARRLFAEPAGPGAASFAERESVDYLLVATARPADLGARSTFETDLEALRDDPGYILIQSFGDGRLLLFRILR